MCRMSMHTSSQNRGAFDCSVAELVWVFVVLFVLSNFPSCALVLVFAGLGWKNGGSYSMFVIFLFPLYFSGSESAWNA